MSKCYCGKCNFAELTKLGKPYICPRCKGRNTKYNDADTDSDCLREDIICHDCGYGT